MLDDASIVALIGTEAVLPRVTSSDTPWQPLPSPGAKNRL
jgi:hypothetical protein